MWKFKFTYICRFGLFVGKKKQKHDKITKELTSTNVFLIIEIFLKFQDETHTYTCVCVCMYKTLYMDKLSRLHLSISV